MNIGLKNNSYLVNFDRILLGLMVFLIVFGIYLQFNIAASLGGEPKQMGMFVGQLKSLIVAFIIFLLFFYPPWISKFLYSGTYFFWLALLALLIITLKTDPISKSNRWISFMNYSFQPSQLAHPVLIIVFARIAHKKQELISKAGIKEFLLNFWSLLVISGITFVLIYKGRHLSTLIVLGSTLMTLLFLAGFKKRILLLLTIIVLCCSIYYVKNGDSYRMERIELWEKYFIPYKYLGIERKTVQSESNQVIESITAISQGSILGTGSDKGRAKHRFLPEINSDYIYSMIGEQFGFIGGFLIIIIYCIILFRSALISVTADTFFQKMLVLGLSINIFITAFVNIGVAMSALPSTGLPLPFVSHGGSALVVNVGMFAIILNLSIKRKTVAFNG